MKGEREMKPRRKKARAVLKKRRVLYQERGRGRERDTEGGKEEAGVHSNDAGEWWSEGTEDARESEGKH
jgi:hypothetical protein